jgi:hypothetical protein
MVYAHRRHRLALVSLPVALKSQDKIIIVAWIAHTFLATAAPADHYRWPERAGRSV